MKSVSRTSQFASLSLLFVGSLLFSSCQPVSSSNAQVFDDLPPALQEMPNILWITAEDMSARLGSYGDEIARTPHLDDLAEQGMRFTRVFTAAGVCSPNRAATITGMHQSSFGAHHMRTLSGAPYAPPPTPYSAVPPHYVRTFTEYLRAAGYYTSNNVKTDYQFETPFTSWDESSSTAHWRNREEGQPFFSVFNFTTTHESQIWPNPNETLVTDPAAVEVPPYFPDSPVIRNDIARHYDNIADMDAQAGEILRQLEEDGLEDNTIVFFWSDHGDGLPRGKRWTYDSGLHVPLIVRAPDYLEPGSTNDELVSFVDLAPTILSLAGLDIPVHMQGRPFLGPKAKDDHRAYIFAARDRFDEQYDMVRTVRDERYKYIRNYYPLKPYVLWMAYANQMPSMQELFRLHEAGELTGTAALWFRNVRPVHELYDTELDPFELNNLADDLEYADERMRLEERLDQWMVDIDDMGKVSELEMVERFWPNGVQPETGAPAIIPRNRKDTIIRPNGVIPTEVNGGTFEGPVTITMYSPTQGASIGYTTEEGPDARWRLFTQPIRIEKTTTIRAKAIRYGYKESAETIATFTLNE